MGGIDAKMINEQLIKYMKKARHSHELWEKYQRDRRRKGIKRVEYVGCETFHRQWVKIYDETIKVLKNDK